jgi:hypothetical protein
MSAIAFSRPKAQRNVSVGQSVLHTPIRVCPDEGASHVNRSGRVGLNNKTGLENPIGGDKPARHHTFLRRPRPFTSEAKDTARHIPLSIGSVLGCWREPGYILTTSVCTRLPTARFFNGSTPAKALVSGRSLAGPAAGETRCWTSKVCHLSVSSECPPPLLVLASPH